MSQDAQKILKAVFLFGIIAAAFIALADTGASPLVFGILLVAGFYLLLSPAGAASLGCFDSLVNQVLGK